MISVLEKCACGNVTPANFVCLHLWLVEEEGMQVMLTER
jgi:hypothetical protein